MENNIQATATLEYAKQDLTPEVLKQVVAKICQRIPDVCGVYLFGSQASGGTHQQSDMDVAILLDGHMKAPIEVVQLWDLAQILSELVGKDVDLVDLRGASTVMRMQIIAKDRRIACFDAWVCETFEDFVFSDYARLNEERADILESIGERGVVYG